MLINLQRSPKTILCFMIGVLASSTTMPAHAVLCGTILSPISVSATQVNYGIYDPSSASPTSANGAVTIDCAIGVDILPSFVVRLSTGQSASYTPRKMASGPSLLTYNLYTTASHATIWGDGTGGTSTNSYGGLLALPSIILTVYGSIPAGQYVIAGSYTDNILVTVEY